MTDKTFYKEIPMFMVCLPSVSQINAENKLRNIQNMT